MAFLIFDLTCDRTKHHEIPDETHPPGHTKIETRSYYSESPDLKELADKGVIPPVQDRLPANPVLIQPEEEAGAYGGVWRMGLLEPREYGKIFAFVEYESLVRWNPQWEAIVPNIAQSVTVNDSMTVFTFVLRKGMKWSDGAEFTADDIEFWYDHVLCDQAVTPRIPVWLQSEGAPPGFEKRDAQTFRFIFGKPQPFFLKHLAHPHGAEMTRYPKHDLVNRDQRPDFKKRAESGFPGGIQQDFPGCVCDLCWDLERPSLNAWVPCQKNEHSIVFNRNPYYWKIDLAFKQLPYIDQVEFRLFHSPHAFVKAIKNGEIHYIDSYLSFLQRISNLNHHNSGQMYYDINLFASESNVMVLGLNLCHPDPERRALFQNKQFRIALSLAIDREKIITQILGGQVRPCQPAPSSESPYYHENLATQYTAYLPDSSRKLIDSVRESFPGDRERTGRPVRLTLNAIIPEEVSYLYLWKEILPFIRSQWKRLGIDLNDQVLASREFQQRIRDGNFDMVIGPGYGGIDPVIDPSLYFPYDQHSWYAYPWAMAFQSGDPAHSNSEPPVPRDALKQMALYEDMTHTIDPDRQKEMMKQMLDLSAEAFYVIGISEMPDRTAWVRSDSYNVLPVMPYAWSYPTPGPSNPCQYTINIPE